VKAEDLKFTIPKYYFEKELFLNVESINRANNFFVIFGMILSKKNKK